MTEAAVTLAQWLSPSFPVGAFAYSHGLEAAVNEGTVRCAATLQDWLEDVIAHGGGRSDAILLAAAWRADDDAGLAEAENAARAYAPAAERLTETQLQGQALGRTISAVWGHPAGDLCYPVALGAAARREGLPLELTLRMYLHAFAANLVSAAVRLMPLGQTAGQQVLHALTPLCAAQAQEAAGLGLEALASCAFASDIAAMRHEVQEPRLFKT